MGKMKEFIEALKKGKGFDWLLTDGDKLNKYELLDIAKEVVYAVEEETFSSKSIFKAAANELSNSYLEEEWICTDSDCMQYCMMINENEYKFIQAVWLDTCGDDKRAENAKDESDNYAVCVGYIDLDLYSEEEMEGSIESYGYTMETVKEIYGDDYKQIIAECLFEDECLTNDHSIAEIVSWDDAEKIIKKYMGER